MMAQAVAVTVIRQPSVQCVTCLAVCVGRASETLRQAGATDRGCVCVKVGGGGGGGIISVSGG